MTARSQQGVLSSEPVCIGDRFKLPDGIWTVLYLNPGGVVCLQCKALHMQIEKSAREVCTWERVS